MTREEMETSICFNRYHDWCVITTTDPIVKAKLQKRLGLDAEVMSTNVWRFKIGGKRIPLPKAYVRRSSTVGANLRKKAILVAS